MSSVYRGFSQTPTRTLWAEDDAYIHTFAEMQAAFADYEPTYVGSLILFKSETDLGDAVDDLESGADYTGSHVSLLDLGKKVYLGVIGGEARHFTYNLIRVEQGNYKSKTFFVLVGTQGITSTIDTALDGSGEVLVGRGAV